MAEAVATKSSPAKQAQGKARGPAPTRARGKGAGPSYGEVAALHRTSGNHAVASLMEPHIDRGVLPSAVADAIRMPGHPLDPETREFMESRFGQDFGHVRLHTDVQADTAAASRDAGALTVGNDVVFGQGFYRPSTPGGKIVLAHELSHVVQQRNGKAASSPTSTNHEHEAHRVGEGILHSSGRVQVSCSAEPGIACMSIAEARRALWSHVPDSVKEYVRPIAQEAAKEMDKVIPPDTEIPKPVEALATHPVETLTTAVQNPAQTLKDVSDVVSTAKPAMSNAAAAIGRTVKQKAKEKLRDYTMESVGELKGIVLEATNIVDTLAWLPYAEHQLARKIVGTGASADALMAANDFLTDYAALNAISEKFGLSETDATGKPTGGFAVSGAVSKKFDVGADKLEAAFGSVPKEEALIFTSYEKGELEGAIGSQVALAFVGVEEVQLVLKAVGAIGGIEGIVQTIQRDPEGWSKNPAFWGAVLNTVLSVIGLKSARAGRKIINIAIASGGVLNAVPAVWQIYNDYTDAKLAQKTEERDKKLKDDLKNLIKILSSVAMEIARHGAAKRTTEPTPGTQEGVGTAPSTQPREPSAGVQGGTAATPTEAAPPSPPQPVTGAGAEASSPAVQPSEASLRTQGPPEATTTATPTGSVAAPSGLELAEEPQPTRPVTHGEIDMGPQTPSGLELDRGPKPTRDVPFGERDLGPVPPGKGLQVYEGSKPIDKIPGVRKVQPTFGEASTEKAGTESRSGMSFHELNAAEIVQGLNLNYDPVAGRTRSVSYRVDTATVSEAAVTERTFTRDLSIEGAQSKDSVYTNSGYERGHLAQREAFKGQAETEQAADHFTNVVPMTPELNRGAGSPWRAAETDTIKWAKQYGSVQVQVEPIYDSNPPRLTDGTPIPKAIRRTVTAPDGTVLQDVSFLNR